MGQETGSDQGDTGVILGFTGSRHNRPNILEQKLFAFLCDNYVKEFHHGDCTGWDEQCHNICRRFGIRSVIHPPSNDEYRAFCYGNVVLPPKPYLDRNKDIVNACDFLIAAPDGPKRKRSGTWSTVRYAKSIGRNGVVWMA